MKIAGADCMGLNRSDYRAWLGVGDVLSRCTYCMRYRLINPQAGDSTDCTVDQVMDPGVRMANCSSGSHQQRFPFPWKLSADNIS